MNLETQRDMRLSERTKDRIQDLLEFLIVAAVSAPLIMMIVYSFATLMF